MQQQLSTPYKTQTVYYPVTMTLGFVTYDAKEGICVVSTPKKLENMHVAWTEMVPHMMIQPDGSEHRDGKRIPRRRLFEEDAVETQPEPEIKFDLAHWEAEAAADPDATVIFVAEDPNHYCFDVDETDEED